MGKLIYGSSNYLQGMIGLLPKGPAWELDESSLFYRLMQICADEFARIDLDIAQLVEESDPRTASATLSDWFDEWGIPDDCLKLLDDPTTEDYRKVLILKITTLGLTFEELVTVIGNYLGYDASVGDTDIHTVASTVDARLYDVSWRNTALIVSADETVVNLLTVDDRVSMALAEWGDELWECLITALAPAHNNVIFQYGSDEE
jgi:uncharacterized protein YmfQ (DUF2313 family)